MSEKTRAIYNIEKVIKKQIEIIGVNREVPASKLVEEYLLKGIETDKQYLTSHMKK